MAIYKLKFHPRFVEELEMAIAYYNEQSPGVGNRFKSAVKTQLNSIKKAPQLRAVRYDNIRFARIGRFPYAIHYSIDIPNKIVTVQSLLSDHQDSEVNWNKRF